jgi:hypothetical protein
VKVCESEVRASNDSRVTFRDENSDSYSDTEDGACR